MRVTKRQLRRIIREEVHRKYRRQINERYFLNEGDSSAEMLDHDPVTIAIPALEDAFSSELQDSPGGKGFDKYFAQGIVNTLEGDEPNIEDFNYDEEEFEAAKKVWDAVDSAGADRDELIQSVKDAMETAEDYGYTS
tara:strand:- start:133 stop:543 length:411 start_codon:yes stop_codon:yes gene_type:complete